MTLPVWAPFINEWTPVLTEWMHPAALISAVVVPFLRGAVRLTRGSRPCFKMTYVVHDLALGLSMPSFGALFLCTIAPELLDAADRHTLMLAGALGLIFVLRETFSVEHH